MSQVKLAEAAEVEGLSGARVSQIESGRRRAGLDEAIGIARAFEVSIEALIYPDRGAVDLLRWEVVQTLRDARRSLMETREALAKSALMTARTIVDLPYTDPTTGNPYISLGDNVDAGRTLDEALTSARFWLEEVPRLTRALDAVIDNPMSHPIRQRQERMTPMGTRDRQALVARLDVLVASVLPDDEFDPVEGPVNHA